MVRAFLIVPLFLTVSLAAWGQMQTRSVHGTVTDEDGRPVANAIVKLENLTTLQVRSYITQEDGAYGFHGLSMEIAYEIRARTKDGARAEERLEWFDSRKNALVNLRVEK